MNRPTICAYCKGTGMADSDNECGFCDTGEPLDTQEDWDRTWGSLGRDLRLAVDQAAENAADPDHVAKVNDIIERYRAGERNPIDWKAKR